MKTSYIKAIAFILVMLAGTISYAQISKAEISATGLTCSMCSNAINKQLKGLAEVDSVGVDLNTNTFTVHFDKNSNITPKVLKDAVEKAGFFVGTMVLTAEFDAKAVENESPVIVKESTYVLIKDKTADSDTTKYKVLDKGFVTQKEYKKLVKTFSKHPTYLSDNENDFHLKAI